eukprot:CAMPEP_0205936784 /NCGR_PEP_ID=MMETSP1325-20131115/42400_1 /ASSEMBLY_ACC=CAM_ASM_000708 /TAXON_ID=236786 /ORGANISM="Florenciella sp., Strain RCC1007" /LENGTH=68 /DNA_ID=CAMNT_0053306977 /DNA_START=41 /DNA_END=243 /DNA_ORIENTATION=-
MTQVPFCSSLIDVSLLTPAELEWIDTYHTEVRETVTPLLTPAAARWLAKETALLGPVGLGDRGGGGLG